MHQRITEYLILELPEEEFVDEKFFTSGSFAFILTVEQLLRERNSLLFSKYAGGVLQIVLQYLVNFMGMSPGFAGKMRIVNGKEV